MLTGIGAVMLRSGRTLTVEYQFGDHQEHHWIGYLIVETAHIDPSEFADKILLHCDEGTAIELAVTDWTARHMAVVGRPLPALDRAA